METHIRSYSYSEQKALYFLRNLSLFAFYKDKQKKEGELNPPLSYNLYHLKPTVNYFQAFLKRQFHRQSLKTRQL